MTTSTGSRSSGPRISGSRCGNSLASVASAATAWPWIWTGCPGRAFFPDARLNFAENLLARRDGSPALIFDGEGQRQRTLTRSQLSRRGRALCGRRCARPASRAGDRVAAYLPNMPEAIVAALAAASIGAVWSSCSPDFGVQGVLDRFGQIEPRILIAADGYFYGGKTHDLLPRIIDIALALPTVERVVVVPYVDSSPRIDAIPHAVRWERVRLEQRRGPGVRAASVRSPALHPVLVRHDRRPQVHRPWRGRDADPASQGTPAPLRHPARRSRLLLHDARLDDVELAGDGAGVRRDAAALRRFAVPSRRQRRCSISPTRHGMTLFGTSAKFIDAVHKAGLSPIDTHRLATVRTMTSTGSPLAPESFDFVYEPDQAGHPPRLDLRRHRHRQLLCRRQSDCARSGGGRSRAAALGMKVEVFDDQAGPRGAGGRASSSARCRSRRCRLASGTIPDGRKYHAAYFETYPGVWRHGDYVELTEHGGLIIYGRSDAVLNPGGVRIGTAEIYRQVEQLDEVVESLVIGQQWDNDERIVLFVRLRDGHHAFAGAGRSDPAPHPRQRHAAARAGTHRRRSPRYRAPRAARSLNSRCAMSCTGAR